MLQQSKIIFKLNIMAKKISKKKVASPKKKEVKKKPEVIVATNSTVQFVPHVKRKTIYNSK